LKVPAIVYRTATGYHGSPFNTAGEYCNEAPLLQGIIIIRGWVVSKQD